MRSGEWRRGTTALAVSMALTGCAGYVAAPLELGPTEQVLAAPNAARLTRQAAALCNPRVASIKLDLSKPLSGDELAVIAVLVNPDLKAARAKLGVADAQVFQAGLLPDPQLAAGAGFPTSGQPSLVTAFNLGLTWDLLGIVTRRAANRVSAAKREQVRNDVAWQEWAVANQTQQQAERIVYLEARHALADKAATNAAQLLARSRRDFERRDITIDQLALRQVAALDAHDRALALGRSLAAGRLELNRNLGLPPQQQVPISMPEATEAVPLDAATLFDRAQTARLDLRALRAGYQAEEAQLQQDLLARFPQVIVGPQLARDTSAITTVGFSAAITLPIFDGGRGAVAVSRATRAQLRTEYAARLFQTRADIAALVADIGHADREIGPLRRQLPALARAEQVMRDAVAGGDVPLVSYETVRQNLLTQQLALSSLEQARAEQRIALQLAVGEPWTHWDGACERPSS